MRWRKARYQSKKLKAKRKTYQLLKSLSRDSVTDVSSVILRTV